MVNFDAKLTKNRHILNPLSFIDGIKHYKNLKNHVNAMRGYVSENDDTAPPLSFLLTIFLFDHKICNAVLLGERLSV